MINVYNTLKIPPTTSIEEIKKVINREYRVWSNRTNAPQIERRQEAEWMVKLLEEAEKILLNPEKRAKYDHKLKTFSSAEERHVDEAALRGKGNLVQQGRRLLAEGNIADALYVATKATEKEGNNPEAWALLAQAKFRWGDIEDAIYEYKRAIKLRPNEAEYYFDLGTVYESMEKWKEAHDNYEKATRIKPNVPMYRAAIGSIYVRLEMFDEAIQILEQCVAQEPNNEAYQWFLAIAYHDGMMVKWWKNPDGDSYYCISKQQADEARQTVEKIKALKFDDPEMSAQFAETEKLIQNLYTRKFVGSWVVVVFLGLFYIIPGVLWWFANRRPVYKINKDVHYSATKRGGKPVYALPPALQWLVDLFPGWGALIVVIALSPISLFYSLYDNYIAE